MNKLSPIARVVSLAFAVVVAAAACTGSSTARPNPAVSNRMDTVEFRRPEFRTIYDAIQAVHPDWLLARGAAGPRTPTRQNPTVGVFFEGESRGYTLDKLADLVGGDVRSIRRISASESLGTYGPDWAWGGIVITRAR